MFQPANVRARFEPEQNEYLVLVIGPISKADRNYRFS